MTQTTPKNRKEYPMYRGLLCYFPDALEEVAHVSYVGNKQHHGGEDIWWDKTKSIDEPDAMLRHLKDHTKGEVFDTDGLRHLAKVAWRALANLQRELESTPRR